MERKKEHHIDLEKMDFLMLYVKSQHVLVDYP